MNERNSKPENVIQNRSTDPRIVYGARCVWWDSISKASTKRGGLPCCPHCGSVLFEVDSELVWWTNVDAFAEKSGDPEYRAFVDWLRGRCYPTLTHAQIEYRLHAMEREVSEPRGEPGGRR